VTKRAHVCSEPGCPNLTPCPIHGRKQWTPERSSGPAHAEHMALRRALLPTRGQGCERCGARGVATTMHHIRPENVPSAVLFLCGDCHREVDVHAR